MEQRAKIKAIDHEEQIEVMSEKITALDDKITGVEANIAISEAELYKSDLCEDDKKYWRGKELALRNEMAALRNEMAALHNEKTASLNLSLALLTSKNQHEAHSLSKHFGVYPLSPFSLILVLTMLFSHQTMPRGIHY